MSTVSSFLVSTKAEAEDARPSSKPLTALTKVEASDWLRALGEEPSATWTSMEIKSRIKEILDLLDEEDGKLPRNLTGMKKADLQRECTERNIHFTEHETKGSLMRKIREKVEVEKGGKSGSIMGFGKFADMTYGEVAENHPAYVQWARDTVKEEGFATSAKLRKFVTWLNSKDGMKSGRSSSATASTARPRAKRGAPTRDVDDMKAEIPLLEENPTPKNRVEELILGALEKMDRRLSTLETTQAQPEKSHEQNQAEKHSEQNQAEKNSDGAASASWQNLPSDGAAEKGMT